MCAYVMATNVRTFFPADFRLELILMGIASEAALMYESDRIDSRRGIN